MLSLKNHPFAVEAFFKSSIVLTFAIPEERIQHLIPDCLSLDTFNDQWAFIAVAMVQTKDLRPKGFPKFLGHDFFLTGYRVFVQYVNNAGKRLRGLFILKSETDNKMMEFFGNIFTHYKYTTHKILQTITEVQLTITSPSGFKVVIDNGISEPLLPHRSPFTDWKEARRFAGPLPFTFTVNTIDKTVLIIEGVRENWKPEPVQVKEYQIPFLKSLDIGEPVLANSFIIKDIPYYWKKGKLETWD